MKKLLVVSTASLALVLASAAFAAPRALSSAELDSVAAGSGIDLAGTIFTTIGDALAPSYDNTPSGNFDGQVGSAEAQGDNAIAVSGESSSQAVAGAVATNEGTAISGRGNVLLDQSGNLAIGFAAAGEDNVVADQSGSDIAQIGSGNATLNATNIDDVKVDDGSAFVIGDNNQTHVLTDDSTVFGLIAAGSYGVVAREATITDSFNTQETDIDVKVHIDNSFNCTTNTQDIAGQNNLSAIVNANTLGNAAVGSNLNVTTATASVPTSQESGTGGFQASIPIISGNALAATFQNQIILNYVAINGGDIYF